MKQEYVWYSAELNDLLVCIEAPNFDQLDAEYELKFITPEGKYLGLGFRHMYYIGEL